MSFRTLLLLGRPILAYVERPHSRGTCCRHSFIGILENQATLRSHAESICSLKK